MAGTRVFSSVAEALQFAAEREAQGRHADALAVYRRLRASQGLAPIEGRPAAQVVLEGCIRNASRAGQPAAALEDFQRLLALLGDPCDAEFRRIYCAGLELTANPPLPLQRMFRFFELSRLLRATRGVAGDVAECGCYRGLSAYVIASYLRREDPGFQGRGFAVFDSFAGLSEPGPQDRPPAAEEHTQAERLRTMSRAGAFAASLDEVRAALADFPGIAFHRGWIPQSFLGLEERRYRFVHVDVDLYAPTLACLRYFYPRLAAGGSIVSDDYSWPGAQQAIAEFAREAGAQVATNEHGQAVIPAPA